MYYLLGNISRSVFGLKISAGYPHLVSLLFAWPMTLLLGLHISHKAKLTCFPRAPVRGEVLLCLGVTAIGMVPVITNLVALVPMTRIVEQAFQQAMSGNPAVVLIAMGILAPAAEEFFFRGILLSNFLARYSRIKSIWATAILFALFHLNPWQAIAALPLGLLLAWFVIRTKALLPAIMAHALYNLTSLVSTLYRGHGHYEIANARYSTPVFFAALAVTLFSLYVLTRTAEQTLITE